MKTRLPFLSSDLPWELYRLPQSSHCPIIIMRLHLSIILAGFLPLTIWAQRTEPPSLLLDRGLHHQVIGLVSTGTDEAGGEMMTTNTFVQLATGLNYVDDKGELVPARAEFELVEGGAIALHGQHKVSVAGNPNAAEAVILQLPDGQLLSSQVLGLAYTDASTGESVLLAQVHDTEGFLISPNQILFPGGLSGQIEADLRYTYTLAGFEQDIILREAPPAPEKYGLTPETTRLEVWTEFPEAPSLTRTVRELGPTMGADELALDGLVDETIDFGTFQLGPGRAFTTDDEAGTLAMVAKEWIEAEGGRQFLVETVAVEAVADALEMLPPAQEGAGLEPAKRFRNRLQAFRDLPGKLSREQAARGRVHQPALEQLVALVNRPGLVLDWIGLNSSQTNRTFMGHETYWITGPVILFGTNTVFEGGVLSSSPTTWPISS